MRKEAYIIANDSYLQQFLPFTETITMRYLCPAHVDQISSDPIIALTLWHQAVDAGTEAEIKNDWTAARSCFGAAFETAALLLASKTVHHGFTFNHLVKAGMPLCKVLRELKLWEEAQDCLMLVQQRLLRRTAKNAAVLAAFLQDTENLTQQLLTTYYSDIDSASSFENDATGNVESKNNKQVEKPNIATPVSTDQNIGEKSNPDLDTLIASTLYLMTRFNLSTNNSLSANDKLRAATHDHLHRIEQATGTETLPTVHKTARRLGLQWRQKTILPGKVGSPANTDGKLCAVDRAKSLH